jgi:hypothetical protein
MPRKPGMEHREGATIGRRNDTKSRQTQRRWRLNRRCHQGQSGAPRPSNSKALPLKCLRALRVGMVNQIFRLGLLLVALPAIQPGRIADLLLI